MHYSNENMKIMPKICFNNGTKIIIIIIIGLFTDLI